MRALRLLFLALLCLPARAQESAAKAPWKSREIADGVVWKSFPFQKLNGARMNVNVLDVDLGKARLRFVHAGGLKRTSTMAEGARAVAAVNGGYYHTSNGMPYGLLKVDGKLVQAGDDQYPAIGVDAKERVAIQVPPRGDWNETVHALGCGPALVQGGRVKVGELFNHANARHPRTAVGLTAKNHLILVTVDGRCPESAGMDFDELGKLLIDLGCVSAINMDGGGSTTMWLRGEGVVNRPSDKRERGVGNAIVILAPRVIPGGEPERKGTEASWKIAVADAGSYEVQLRWAKGTGSSAAKCRFGDHEVKVDHTRKAGEWVTVGTVNVAESGEVPVTLTGGRASSEVRLVER